MKKEITDIVQLQRNIALQRDQQSYKHLYYYFYTPLIRFAKGFVRSEQSAEEIYSDIFMKLWDLGPALENIGNLKIYLYKSIKNASLNYLAKYHKVSFINLEDADIDVLPEYNLPDKSLIQKEFQRNAALAIKSLPPQTRLVYKLIKEEGFSYKEVSSFLNISVNTVESHMKTAIKKLRVSLSIYLSAAKN